MSKSSSTPWKNPVIEELRDFSEELANRFDGDVKRIAEFYRQCEATHPERVVDRSAALSPRKPGDEEDDADEQSVA